MTTQPEAQKAGAFASAQEELHTFMKLKGSIREEAWPLRYFGVIHAQVHDGSSRPLMGFEGLEHARFVPQPDGSFNMLESMETYFTDLVTGEYLSTFANPITGAMNEVVSNYAAGESYRFSSTAITPLFGDGYTAPETGPGLRWFRSADRLWVQYDRTYPDQWWKPASELITFEGNAAEVMRPDVSGVEAAFSSTTILPWFKWLRMADIPGWTLSAAGRAPTCPTPRPSNGRHGTCSMPAHASSSACSAPRTTPEGHFASSCSTASSKG